MDEAAPQAAGEQELAALQFNWGEAYLIGCDVTARLCRHSLNIDRVCYLCDGCAVYAGATSCGACSRSVRQGLR